MGVVSSVVAFTIGFAALAAGGTAVGLSASAGAKKQAKEQKQLKAWEIEEQQKATAEMLAAPGKAAEKARLEGLEKRRRRSKTILTSSRGVLNPATTDKKTLLGA